MHVYDSWNWQSSVADVGEFIVGSTIIEFELVGGTIKGFGRSNYQRISKRKQNMNLGYVTRSYERTSATGNHVFNTNHKCILSSYDEAAYTSMPLSRQVRNQSTCKTNIMTQKLKQCLH